MAHAEKNRTAAQWAEKKAARRAAFIQEVAEAVHKLLWSGLDVVAGPFATSFLKYEQAQKQAERVASSRAELLSWSKYMSLVPKEATELPNDEVQRYLLATIRPDLAAESA